MSRREIPVSPLEDPDWDGFQMAWVEDPHRPETDIQALMEAAPFQEPERSKRERLALRDTLADAIDSLEPIEQWIFEATVIERRSYRQVARDIGYSKSSIHRIRDRAIRKLQEILREDENVSRYLATQRPIQATQDDYDDLF